jgi:hypothetical protein
MIILDAVESSYSQLTRLTIERPQSCKGCRSTMDQTIEKNGGGYKVKRGEWYELRLNVHAFLRQHLSLPATQRSEMSSVITNRDEVIPDSCSKKIFEACYRGHVDEVKRLLDAGADVNGSWGGLENIMWALIHRQVAVVRLLHSRGADLSWVDKTGPQVLQHALDPRWSSVKHLLLISNFHETSDFASACFSAFNNLRSHSDLLSASVFTITGLVRHIAEYLIRMTSIVKDPATKNMDKESDDVKMRVEATLAANEESIKKKARNK